MSQLFNSEFAEAKSDVKLLAGYSGNFGRGLRKDVDKVASESKLVGSRSKSWLLSEINQRLVQISIFASVFFWLLGSYDLINKVQNLLGSLGLNFGHGSTRLVHAVIFGFLLYFFIKVLMDPLFKRLMGGVEGQANKPSPPPLTNEQLRKLAELLQGNDAVNLLGQQADDQGVAVGAKIDNDLPTQPKRPSGSR